MIYSDVGSDNTTVSRIFINSLSYDTYNTPLIFNPVTDATEFIKKVIRKFYVQDIPATKKKSTMCYASSSWKSIKNGIENVLVIDEA